MSTLAHWSASLLLYGLYAYVVGTTIWLFFAAPGMYKRQRQMLRRIEVLEQRLGELTPVR